MVISRRRNALTTNERGTRAKDGGGVQAGRENRWPVWLPWQIQGVRVVVKTVRSVAIQSGSGCVTGVTGCAQIDTNAVSSDAQHVGQNFQGETENGFDEHGISSVG